MGDAEKLFKVDKWKYFEKIGYKPHIRQLLFHQSDARFRVPICGRRMGKTVMGAKEIEPVLMMPNKRVWIVGPCVDEETEILTQRGWLKYNEVRVGDETLSINPITGLSEWDSVRKVLKNPGVHDMIRMEGHSFSALATPEHRWLTHRRLGLGYRYEGSKLPAALKPIAHLLPETDNGWTWRTTETLTADDRIPRAAPIDSACLPETPKYTDEFVEIVAWLWTEGSVDSRHNYTIHQSHVVNEHNVVRIRAALTALCPKPIKNHSSNKVLTSYWSERIPTSNPSKTCFYLGTVLSKEFEQVFYDHKKVKTDFIRSLTRAQLQLFVDISLAADGTIGNTQKNGYLSQQKVIYQDNEAQLFAVQLACSLLGIATSLRPRTKDGRNGYVLGLLTSTFVNPKRAQYVAGENGIKITREIYTGTTWCVTTRNGNWLAKRHGKVYFTANTYDLAEKEFRVVWQDMILKLGFGKEKSVKRSYSKKQGSMSIEFPWGSALEVRSADRPENLVGDGLDYVIMAEAAKHDEETWTRFVRPALTDRRGKATFSSCVSGNTMIVTEDGIIEIGSLYNGEVSGTYVPYERMVAGFAGPMEKATKFYVNGRKDTIKVSTGLGSVLEGTLNHPVWCMRNGVAQWVELQDLHVGDWLATRVGANVWGNNDDTSDFDQTFSHENQKDFALDLKLTPKMMWLLGYIIGNGYIDFANNRVAISTAEPKIITALQYLGFKNYPGPNTENKYRWQLGRKVFVDYLRYLGFNSKLGPNKTIPTRLLKCSEENIRYLLSGLFDADGTAHKTKNSVRFTSSSKRLVEQVQFLLINFGIVGRVTYHLQEPTDRVEVFSHKYELDMSGGFAKKFHDNIGFRIPRKRRTLTTKPNRFYGIPTCANRFTRLFEKYSNGKGNKGPNLTTNLDYMRTGKFSSYEKVEKFLSILEPHAWYDEDWQYLKQLCEQKYYWSQVKELTKSSNLTFDLVIPTTHSFVTNTIISHNTPEGQNWLHRIWQMGRDPNEPDFESWQFPSWDNPNVYPGGRNDPEILLLERTTPREIFLQEYAADFTSFSGKVYSEFQENVHVQNVTYDPRLKNYISFDWGFVAPMAAIEFQVDPFGRVRVWREHYKSRTRLKDFLGELKSRPQPEGYKIDLCFGDAADPEAVASVSVDFSPCYADPLSKSNWREGVELVQGFLKEQETGEEDEFGTPKYEPWLIIDHSCPNIIREFNNYRTAEPAKGRERNPREDAQKWDDHALDALRYGMMHVFKLGATQSLSSVVTREQLAIVDDRGYFTTGIKFA